MPIVGTFVLNGKRYRLEPTDSLSEATHFVTEINQDERDLDTHGDEHLSPEYLSLSRPNIDAMSGNVGLNGKHRRLKRMIPEGVDIIEIYIFADDFIYKRYISKTSYTRVAIISQVG
ncbi:hypothetical protein CHS0354_017326 [Potamilus streckersoni]|uniref:Uncharacterized protein n=1 Tax=Potamilus streckersoni TaxID=2493646 RepID=A0AAE0T5K6_9BIVA|nr:hypothetical protein CHS0354_017326 [Potamilus streckersoni]